MEAEKRNLIFVQGAIPSRKIARSIADHRGKGNIGAYSIFLGQVRADEVDGKTVASMEYTAYEEMAEKIFGQIKEAAFSKFHITCAHIYHSLGTVKAGELCLFVFTASTHRKAAMEATDYFVEEIKAKAPIFGKEIFEDKTYQWKVNQ